jgi:uncharacterized protein YqiB (DUF1249 family)
MADRDESTPEPDQEIHIFHDGATVEAIHAERGLRGYGATDLEALHNLVAEVEKEDRPARRYDWQ